MKLEVKWKPRGEHVGGRYKDEMLALAPERMLKGGDWKKTTVLTVILGVSHCLLFPLRFLEGYSMVLDAASYEESSLVVELNVA